MCRFIVSGFSHAGNINKKHAGGLERNIYAAADGGRLTFHLKPNPIGICSYGFPSRLPPKGPRLLKILEAKAASREFWNDFSACYF